MGDRNTNNNDLSALYERLAILEEKSRTQVRHRDHVRREIEELEDTVQNLEKRLDEHTSSKERIGGSAVHEAHHRHVEYLLQRRKARQDAVKKLKEDMLSKSAFWLIGLILASLSYLYHVLPKYIGSLL